MRIVNGIKKRVRSALPYQRLAWRWHDKFTFLLLGLARCGDFSTGGILSRICPPMTLLLCLRPKKLCGHAVYVDAADSSHIDIFDEVMLEEAYDLERIPFTPDCIIDCGGHIGLYAMLAAVKYPDVPIQVYEPSPANLKVLSLAGQPLNSQIRIVPKAVSDHFGRSTFYIANSCGGSLTHSSTNTVGTVEVEVIDFVEVLKNLASERLLLKMDIEGEEERLIPVLLPVLPHECAIFYETHSGDLEWSSLAKEMEKHGFRVWKLRDRGQYKDGLAIRSNGGTPN